MEAILISSTSRLGAHGIRFSKNCKALIVPLRDFAGELHGLQFIYINEFESVEKRFLQGTQKRGHFHLLGEISGQNPIAIAEGYATGATWFEIIGHPTVIAFDSGNLLAVTAAIRKQYPDNPIVIVGDDDSHLEKNVGKEKALEAAAAPGCHAIFPQFPNSSQKTDFNDLRVFYGASEVQAQWRAFYLEHFELTQEEIEQWIERENDFQTLTVSIVKAISRSHLSACSLKLLQKSIAKKAKVAVSDINFDMMKT